MAKKQPPAYLSQPSDFDFAAGDRFIASLQQSTPPEPEKPSVARRIGDTAVQFGQGAVTGVKMMSDIFGANNAVSSGLSDVNQALDGLLSATAQGDKQKVAQIMQEAEGKGWGEQVVAGLKAAGVDPVGLAANALGTTLPTLATLAIPGAGPAAVAARTGAGIALGAGQGVGSIKGQIYDETKRKWLESGATPEQAEAKAQEAAAYGGQNTDQIALGGALGAASVLGAERALGKVLHGASKAGPGMLGRVASSTLAETGTEMLQGGQEKFATNTALNRQGFDVDPMSGVIANATLEGAAAAPIGAIAGIPKPAVATAPGIDPAQDAADTIRATEKVPESGALTRAVNAGTEAKAQAVEAGAPVTTQPGAEQTDEAAPEAVDDPVRDQILALPDGARQDALRAYAVVNRTDVAKGVQQYNRKLLDRLLAENAPPPTLGARLTDTDMGSMLGGGGMTGRADPLAGALGMNNEAQASSITNVANVAERRPPMPASDAARMLDEARNRGLDLAVAEHPAGGFVLVPPNWVTPDMAAQGEARLNETIARMQQADAAPVERAPRTRTDGVDLDLQTDPVQNYLDNLRSVNTPAARAYVRDFDAGRITPDDVQQRMQAEQGLTPEQRIARAAAEAPAQVDTVAERLRSAAAQGMATPAPTDILNPAGEPFKTKMAADLAAKKTPGAAVLPVVDGGFLVRPQEPANVQDVPQAPEVPQAAPVVSPLGQAPQAVGAQPAGPTAGVPTEGAGAVEAAGVTAKSPQKEPQNDTDKAQAAIENVANDTPQPQSAPVGDEQPFAPETGTLGIPRAEMPQVPTQSHGGLVKHLNAQGIEHETTMVDAAELKPTQAEFSPSKVEKAKEATGDRAVIVSSDGHIIDGHHQALAAAEEGKPVKAIVLDAPVEQALEAVKNSPSAQPQVTADAPVAKPINRSDVDAAQQQTAALIAERIDAMTAQEVQAIARRFLPAMGVAAPAGKERIKTAVTDFTTVNPVAAAAEFGVTLPADVRRALDAEMQGKVAMFSRSPSTKSAYEARIDALFAGEKAGTGTRVLDRSDMMGFLGFQNAPLLLDERHLLDNQTSHPEMTAEQWKKVPQWLDNPVVAYEDRGRIVMIAPETVAGYPVRMVIEPSPTAAKRGQAESFQLLVTVFAKTTQPHVPNLQALADSGSLRYLDTKTAPEIWKRAGAKFPRQVSDLRSRTKILTEKQFDGYRRANNPAAFMGQPTPPADSNARNAATQLLVDGLKAKWTRAPEIIVARNMQDAQIPQEVRDYDALLKSQGATGEPRGFIYKGKVYLLSDELKGPQQIAEVLFHEVLGHYGLRGAFGDSLNSILQQMGTMRRRDVVAKAREYGLFNKDALGGLDKTTASDSQIWAAMSAKNRLSAAEEVLAEMAQTQPTIGFVQRAIAAIRNWLRANVPGFKNLKLTDADIVQAYILPARGYVTRSNETVQQAIDRAMTDAGFSRTAGDQTQTEAFKRWYGDWQNTSDVPKQMEPNRDGAQASRNGGAAPIDGIQRQAGVDQDAARADGARRFTFSGASGPTGADGAPVRLYHGTKDDIAAFDLAHPRRKDKGWLGNGVYLTSNLEDANQYARAKRGEAGPNLMPLYANVRNPYEATMAEKARLKGASPKEIAAFTDGLKAKGHDGVVLWDDSGHMELVAFNTADVKSAIGNNGNFDPEDDRINFSRTTDAAKAVGDTLKSITVANIKQRAGFKLTDYLGIGLQALGRRQIVDIYGDMLPLGEYNRLVQQMEADKNEGGAEADQLVTQWAKLEDEGKLADLMHDATLAQIDPAEDFVEGDDKGKYLELQRKYNLLSDDAKKVYADTRDSYKAHHAKVRSAIKERIERSEIKGERKAALLKQMDDEFFKAIKGVYFPLARFGQYAVTVKGPDGKVESVSRAETKAEAEALRNNLLSAFPRDKGFTVGRVMLSKDFIADRDAVGRGFMTELYQVLDKQDMDAAQRAELEDTLGQLYLSSLPDLSWAKHGIHRKGTPGFSQDARRAFAQNMFHGARYLAKLRYSDLMQDELAAMQRHVDDWREVEDFDQNSAQRVVDEMNKRHESLMNPKSNPLSTALTSLGFVFHLGLSPASAMVNLSQTALVAYPIMGAKWGFGKASAALLKASAEAAKGKNDITASLNADERAAYDEAVRAGTIDVTMAHDLAGIAQGEDAGVMWKIRPVMRWASFLFHHAERFNRQVTFVAAYRLAREAGADHKAAFEQATKATYDGHFDYGAANRPRIMQGNVAKVLLLFKQYGQNMVYTLARNAQQSIKGESPEVRAQARKALGGLLATHAAAAGVLGLPMVTTLLAAASMIGGDDDEPWDAKVALQNMLADTFGQKPAEVLAHGLSRLTPWDISGRVGLDRLIFPDVQEGLEGQRLWESAATQALGPVGGIFGGALKGLDLMSDGHYLLGLEAMLPAVLRQGVKSIRYATEGAQDKGGVVIKDEVSMPAVVGQLLGFSPSEVRLAQEGKSAIYQQDKALGERRQELLTKAARATMAKDAEARAEAMKEIQRFNEKNPTRRITPLNVLQSVRNRQKRIDQAEGGVYLPKNRRDAVEAGRFALAESE